MMSGKAIRRRPLSRGLSPWQVVRLKFGLRRIACSETWVDDQIVTLTETDSDGDEIRIQLFDPRVFPPGGRQETKMRWCRCCGRYTPTPAVHLIEHRDFRLGPVVWATLKCDDCRIADNFEHYRELYDAGLHLRPAGSKSFISRQIVDAARLGNE